MQFSDLNCKKVLKLFLLSCLWANFLNSHWQPLYFQLYYFSAFLTWNIETYTEIIGLTSNIQLNISSQLNYKYIERTTLVEPRQYFYSSDKLFMNIHYSLWQANLKLDLETRWIWKVRDLFFLVFKSVDKNPKHWPFVY